MLQFAGCTVRLAGVRVTPIGVGAPFHSHLRSSKQVVTASWSRPQLHLEYAVVLMSTQHRDNSVVVDDNNTKSGGPYVFVQTCNSSLDPKTLYLVGSWRSFFQSGVVDYDECKLASRQGACFCVNLTWLWQMTITVANGDTSKRALVHGRTTQRSRSQSLYQVRPKPKAVNRLSLPMHIA